MIKFKDINNNAHLAVASISRKHSVNGEKSLSGTIYRGDDVLNNLDTGWGLEFDSEPYVITYFEHHDSDNTISFDAIHKFFWDFSKKMFYRKFNGSNTITAYLGSIFDGTGYRYALNFSPNAIAKDSFGMTSKMSMFNDIITAIGAEFEVNGTLVSIYQKIGTDLSTIVRHGFNLSDMAIQNDISGFATYAEGFGVRSNPNDENSARLHVVYESPLANTYGRIEAEPIDDERYTIQANLLAALKSKVDDSLPVSISLSLYDLNQSGYPYKMAKVGDWITAVDEKINFKQKIRIINVDDEFSSDGTRISYAVTAGNISSVQRYQEANASISSRINNAINSADQANQAAISAQITADGKNAIYPVDSVDNLPTNANEGDLGWVQSGDGQVLYIYTKRSDDSYFWDKRIDPEMGQQIADGVDNAVNQAKDYTNEVASDTNKRLDGKADTAQIDVLKDQINLSVKKGDVINQINLDESGFQIKAKLVILDGPTTVTDAFYALGGNFKNLNASNFTTGTLDASKIRVINIDASQITTGKISGLSMEFRANQGSKVFVLRDDAIRMYDDESFNIQSGEGIKIYKGSISSPNNGILIDVDNNFISSSSYAATAMLKDGALFLTQPQIYDTNSNPYFSISNNGAGFSFYGARLMGREYVALTTSDNSNSGFDFALGQELFVGLAGGRNGNSWFPTKIGGASRGVVLSGGKAYGQFVASSPYIVVGSTPNGSAGSGYGGTRITLAGEYVQIPSAYNQTNSTPANLAVTSTGALVRTTSATKYKTSIHRSAETHLGDKLLEVPIATWFDKATIRRFKEESDEQKPRIEFGMIAEDLAAAGLDWLVVRDPKGEIEGIKYDRLAVALIPVIKNLKNEIEELKNERISN
ncbi:phage tail protein [Periweissella ghanensis]|uniref:Peptidase S74 domain-containing protein n=1 Tax=Periweissella ghanensis TaxID=467997 RepID=A0ABN8BRC4_9LACO|nr:phage tail protein [Periweissella ghanensis]MCM0601414.1 phage tail protein [Periweissella ghanensis]CAH0419475.1 hypothetical protein WGH24286_01934 [Periweissella ghanensis]